MIKSKKGSCKSRIDRKKKEVKNYSDKALNAAMDLETSLINARKSEYVPIQSLLRAANLSSTTP